MDTTVATPAKRARCTTQTTSRLPWAITSWAATQRMLSERNLNNSGSNRNSHATPAKEITTDKMDGETVVKMAEAVVAVV